MNDDLPREFYTLDFPRLVRFTHHPSGDTCLRHQWMIGKDGSAKWQAKLAEFFSRHPGCHLLCSEYSRKPIDDIRNYPVVGGGFDVGDLVVADGIARRITSRKEVQKDCDTDHGFVFVLEDGAMLWWRADSDGWFTDDRTPAGIGPRARPPFDWESFEKAPPTP